MTETPAPAWGRYAELHPGALERLIADAPIAYLPWGALEWHAAHLPLGTEGMIAEALAERAARRTGGVLLPTTWLPIAPVPHRLSIGVRSDIIQELWDSLFAELARAGFTDAVVVTGHYGHGHDLVLMDSAEHALATGRLRVLAVPPLALVDERMLDHAAHWETAVVMALRGDLVAPELLAGDGPRDGVFGETPRLATAGQGEAALRLATERIATVVRAMRGEHGEDVLRELYARRRAASQAYVERYFRGTWEDAAEAWWFEQGAASRERGA